MSSTFKDIVASDRAAVFLNLDEFGTEHDIDGATVTCVVEDIILEDINRDIVPGVLGIRSDHMGAYKSCKRVYALAESFSDVLPAYGRRIILDDEWYLVASARNEAGIYVIDLEIMEHA